MTDITGRHIVSTDWLAANLGAADLVVLDGSWHLPAEKRDAKAEYAAGHIPGALYLDIDEISDHASPLPHMMPSAAQFAQAMTRLGISNTTAVVVYDASKPGLMSAARGWWMLRAMGHDNVAVLDGGLRKWRAEGRALTAEPSKPGTGQHFNARLVQELMRDLAAMKTLVASGTAQIADARSPGRFRGAEPEPRPGLRSGHMPGARSVPFTTLLGDDGTLKPAAELRSVFTNAGIDLSRPVTTSCGSGVTAAVLSIALAITGQPNGGLYDGSWSEWGQASLDTEVATGDA